MFRVWSKKSNSTDVFPSSCIFTWSWTYSIATDLRVLQISSRQPCWEKDGRYFIHLSVDVAHSQKLYQCGCMSYMFMRIWLESLIRICLNNRAHSWPCLLVHINQHVHHPVSSNTHPCCVRGVLVRNCSQCTSICFSCLKQWSLTMCTGGHAKTWSPWIEWELTHLLCFRQPQTLSQVCLLLAWNTLRLKIKSRVKRIRLQSVSLGEHQGNNTYPFWPLERHWSYEGHSQWSLDKVQRCRSHHMKNC